MVDRSVNPFRPGFNQIPPEMAGRDDILDDVVNALETAALDRRTPRPILLTGSRGVGKTVLLSDASDRASQAYGWPRVHVEVRPGRPFIAELAHEVDRLHAVVTEAPPDRTWRITGAELQAHLAGIGGKLELKRQVDAASASQTRLRDALTELVDQLSRRDSGLLLTIDEAQLAAHDEMVDLAAAAQHGTGADWPMVIMLAGLPAMRDAERSATYFERGSWHEVAILSPDATIQALVEPAREAGRPIDSDAAQILAEASGGYPYAIQLYGSYAWRTSNGQQTIDRAAAQAAVPRATRDLERGLYAQRWAAAAPQQRRYLLAVAELVLAGKQPTGGDVATHLGVTTPQLSRVRGELLTDGTLTTDGHYRLRFTIPGMAKYIRLSAAP